MRFINSKAAKEFIAREGYDPVYGARPLKRFLQRHLETGLSRKLLSGEIEDNSLVEVGYADEALTFTAKVASQGEPHEQAA